MKQSDDKQLLTADSNKSNYGTAKQINGDAIIEEK